MAWCRFVYDNTDFDEATLSASSAVSGFPVTNVQNQRRKQIWKSTGVSSEYIDVDFGEEVSCNCLAILNHNFTAESTVTITAGTTAGGSDVFSGSFDGLPTLIGFGSGLFGDYGFGGYLTSKQVETFTVDPVTVCYFGDIYTARYWRIKIEDPTNGDSYLQMGRVFLALYFEPSLMPSSPLRFKRHDPSVVKRSLGGQKWTDELEQYRVMTLNWHNMLPDDWDNMLAMIATVGTRNDLLVDMYFGEEGQDLWFGGYYGRLASVPDLDANVVLNGNLSLTLEESL